MRNIYRFDSELKQLVVTQVEKKTIEDIKRVIALSQPVSVIDKFIALYLPTLEQVQLVADAWYEEHVLVESLDPDEQRFTRTTYDSDGNETIETLPNAYDVALAERDELESSYEWLKALRGVVTEQQPPSFNFDVDVEAWKGENKALFDGYAKRIGTELNGQRISLTEVNQNGLAAIKSAVELAAKYGQNVFPINFKADTATGTASIPFNSQDELELFALQFMAKRQEFFQ